MKLGEAHGFFGFDPFAVEGDPGGGAVVALHGDAGLIGEDKLFVVVVAPPRKLAVEEVTLGGDVGGAAGVVAVLVGVFDVASCLELVVGARFFGEGVEVGVAVGGSAADEGGGEGGERESEQGFGEIHGGGVLGVGR